MLGAKSHPHIYTITVAYVLGLDRSRKTDFQASWLSRVLTEPCQQLLNTRIHLAWLMHLMFPMHAIVVIKGLGCISLISDHVVLRWAE